jgi:hypothetical protein
MYDDGPTGQPLLGEGLTSTAFHDSINSIIVPDEHGTPNIFGCNSSCSKSVALLFVYISSMRK